MPGPGATDPADLLAQRRRRRERGARVDGRPRGGRMGGTNFVVVDPCGQLLGEERGGGALAVIARGEVASSSSSGGGKDLGERVVGG
jgi:hypothetical protein